MVEFHDNPEKYNSAHMLLQLNTEVSSLQHCYYQGIFLFMFEIQCVCWVFRSDKKLSFVKIGLGFNQNFSWQYFLFILICNRSWGLVSAFEKCHENNHCRSDTLKKNVGHGIYWKNKQTLNCLSYYIKNSCLHCLVIIGTVHSNLGCGHCVHFCTNTLGKGMNLSPLPQAKG